MSKGFFERIGVLGAGTMGSQIALHCAVHGRQVFLYSRSKQTLTRASKRHQQSLDLSIESGGMAPANKATVLDRIRLTTDLGEMASQSDLVIENAPEELAVKRELFAQLDELSPAQTILATNSTSLCISAIEDVTRRKDRVLNLHFVTPICDGAVVELMRGTATSDETATRVGQFAQSLELVPLLVRKESRGLILGRIWRSLKQECLQVVEEGIASPEDVDRGWMIMAKMPIGPFGLMDIIGLDVVRDVEKIYHHGAYNEADALPKVLLDRIERGELGVKTGKGFYEYPDPAFQEPGWLLNRTTDT